VRCEASQVEPMVPFIFYYRKCSLSLKNADLSVTLNFSLTVGIFSSIGLFVKTILNLFNFNEIK
jgi:hypothetical protein